MTQRASNVRRSKSADDVSELDITQRTANLSNKADREVKPARAVSDGGSGRWADKSESSDLSKMARSAAAMRGGTRATSRTGSGDLVPKVPGGNRSIAASGEVKDIAPKIPGGNRAVFVDAPAVAVAATTTTATSNLSAMTTAGNAGQRPPAAASGRTQNTTAAKPKKKKKKGRKK